MARMQDPQEPDDSGNNERNDERTQEAPAPARADQFRVDPALQEMGCKDPRTAPEAPSHLPAVGPREEPAAPPHRSLGGGSCPSRS